MAQEEWLHCNQLHKLAWQNLSLLVPVVADGIKFVHVSETLFFKSLLWYFPPDTTGCWFCLYKMQVELNVG